MDLIQFFGRFHVLVLHLPIGILMLSALLELYILYKKIPRNNMLNWIWGWGAISAALACLLGWMLSQGDGYNDQAVFIHRSFGLSVIGIAIICWLYFKYTKKNHKVVGSILAFSQLFLLFTTGHYGANMTHGETYLVEHAPDPVRLLIGLAPHPTPRPAIISLEQADVYLDIIEPLMKKRCVSCHNDSKQKGKLNLATIAGLNKGGRSGNTITAGSAEKSELYKRITLNHSDKKFMPAEGKTPFSQKETNIIAWWINTGAKTTGNIDKNALTKAQQKLLRHFLNLHDPNSLSALPVIAPITNEQANKLTQLGFVLKNITKTSNYLDIDLSISKKPLTENAIKALLDIKHHVVWLNLANTNITNEQLRNVSELPNLMKLRLEHNEIATASLSLLKNIPKLHYLNLYGTPISNEGLATLSTFTSLKNVYLTATNITPEAIENIQDKSPINFHYVAPTFATETE